jgi:hypothetical protein
LNIFRDVHIFFMFFFLCVGGCWVEVFSYKDVNQITILKLGLLL